MEVVFISIGRRLYPFARGLGLVAVLLIAGCGSVRENGGQANKNVGGTSSKSAKGSKGSVAGHGQISIQELDQLSYSYADRFYMILSSAVDAIKRGNVDATQRHVAHQVELDGVLAMNDIVSGNDPYSQVFDLVVSVTLQSMVWIDEDQADQAFGQRAPGLIKALRTLRVEAWALAAKVLTQDQLEELDYLILEWRRTHPEITRVAYVKFANFAGAHAANLLAEVRSGHGLLAPVREAGKALKDIGRLSERIFWYSKRAPNVAAIQAEGAVNEILSAPEITSTLQTGERLGKLAESAPKIMDEERKAIFADIDARQTLLTNTLGDVRYILSDADSLARTVLLLGTNTQQTLASLGDTLSIADRVGEHFGLGKQSTPPRRPFDIQDYTAAFAHLNEVVTNLHQLSLNASQITSSEGWNKALRDVEQVTDRRVDRVFLRLCLLLGLAFVLAIAYRVISIYLTRRLAPGGREKS